MSSHYHTLPPHHQTWLFLHSCVFQYIQSTIKRLSFLKWENRICFYLDFCYVPPKRVDDKHLHHITQQLPATPLLCTMETLSFRSRIKLLMLLTFCANVLLIQTLLIWLNLEYIVAKFWKVVWCGIRDNKNCILDRFGVFKGERDTLRSVGGEPDDRH